MNRRGFLGVVAGAVGVVVAPLALVRRRTPEPKPQKEIPHVTAELGPNWIVVRVTTTATSDCSVHLFAYRDNIT